MSAVGHRLDTLPLGRFHRRLLFIGGSGYAFDGLDSAIIAFILPVLHELWTLSPAAMGGISSITYIGFFLGASLSGLIGDRFGRRPIMMWALALFCAASVFSAFMPQYSAFMACRFIAGIGLGAESAIIAPYLAEFVASRYRGAFTASLAGFFSFGFVAAALLGTFVVPAGPQGWRWAIVLTGAPVLLLLWWRRALPESPRWLESTGRHHEAAENLRIIEAESRPTRPSLPGNSVFPAPAPHTRLSLREQIDMLFSPQMRRPLAVSWSTWFCLTFSYYAVFTWIPSFLIAHGLTMAHGIGFSIAIYAAQIPGYFSAAALIEILGRGKTIAFYLFGSTLSAAALILSHGSAPIIGTAMALSFCLTGGYAGLYAYTPELFPTALRATGVGSASAIGRLGAIISPLLVGLMLPRVGYAGVFTLITVMLLAGAAIVLAFGPATAGLSLDKIDDAAESPTAHTLPEQKDRTP